jgi:hypothetical protein
MKVASSMIGLDIVPVKPMSAPKGNLMYVDYKYGDEEEQRRKREEKLKKRKETIEKILSHKK